MSFINKIVITNVLRNAIFARGNIFIRNISVSGRRNAEAVGFIGLGNMGAHMARNLLKKGHSVIVCDVSKSAVDSLKESGATAARTPAEVAKEVQVVITMLPSSPNVQEVYTGDKGIFSGSQSGSLYIDSSTIDPAVSKEMAELASDKGVTFMDAPVSGGVVAARDALLTFMVGGPEDKFPQAQSILSHMGKNIVHCGDVGTGQAAKICNNMLLAISMIGTAEAMNMGMRLGLDSKLLAKILNMSSGRCWSSELYNPVPGVVPGIPASNDYKGGFGVALMAKDLGLAQGASTATKSPTPLGSLAHQIYRLMCVQGLGGKDFASVYQFLKESEKK